MCAQIPRVPVMEIPGTLQILIDGDFCFSDDEVECVSFRILGVRNLANIYVAFVSV